MQYIIPDYYKEFSCTADQCEDTCCAGWQIVIDDRSIKKYRRVGGRFGLRMKCSVKWREKIFRQDREKRCAFLNEQNLCDLYTNLGEKSLCRTCRLYPRHIEEFEDVREITLSVSCPEVAKMLMRRREPVRFLTYEKDGEEEFEDFDPFLYSMLADAREVMYRILQNRKESIRTRSGMILGMGHDIQIRVQNRKLFECETIVERYQTERAWEFVREKAAQENGRQAFSRAHGYFRELYRLELLRDDWDMLLMETEEILYTHGAEAYLKKEAEFTEWQREHMPEMEIQLEQLLVYFISAYFCGAVYDGRVYAKVRMAVISVFLIRELWKARWIRNESHLEEEEMTELVYRYSRETEHSDKNLEMMENFMEKGRFLF